MLADQIIASIKQCLEQKGRAVLAVSGGSSPLDLYERLSFEDLNWSKVIITLIDDRLVPDDDLDSNKRLIKETLLKGHAASAQFVPLENWSETDIPDLAILGMGTDGHFASLFPSMLDDEDAFDPNAPASILRTGPQGSPRHPRITMSLSMIIAIPFRVLLVTSDEKKSLLDKALAELDLPVSRLLAHDGTQVET